MGEPIDHRIYKQNHQPTCHDITQNPNTNVLHILVGFSKGQIQYINMQTKEQKVFNEGVSAKNKNIVVYIIVMIN